MATDEGISDLSGVYEAYYSKEFLSRLGTDLPWYVEESEWMHWLRGYKKYGPQV